MAKRLPAGFRKRENGSYELRFTVDKKRYSVFGKSIKECREKELIKRAKITEQANNKKNPVVSDWFDEWTHNRRLKVSGNTQRANSHILEAVSKIEIDRTGKTFGSMRIQDVDIEDLRMVQYKLYEERKEDGSRKRKARSVNDYMTVIRHAFKDAKKERILTDNPADCLENLRITEERARDTIHRALTHEEQKLFFECERTKQSTYYNIYRMAILTGMRFGEIGALKNSDIRNGMIHVERTITRTEHGKYIIGDSAKTAAGRRTIPITEEIQSVLNDQREINRLLDGNVVMMDDTVFKSASRNILKINAVDADIGVICQKIGIEHFSMHAFRATFATRCIEQGMNPRTLQELLGHASFDITMSLYGHVIEDTKIDAMSKITIAI